MEECYLTKILADYRSGKASRDYIIEEISLFIYSYALKNCNLSEDLCSDFFCMFYPKIEKIIESFEIRDVPFEAYLIKSIKFQLKTFISRKQKEYLGLCMQKNAIFWPYREDCDLYCCREKKAEYRSSFDEIETLKIKMRESFPVNSKGKIKDKVLRKRAAMMILKNIFSISDNTMPFFAALLGKKEEWLYASRLKLRAAIEKRISRKKMISERRNYQFCKMYQLHHKIYYEVACEDRENTLYKAGRAKLKIIKLNRDIKNINQTPTHNDIAAILRIPKGSVDSGLFYLKKYLEKK